MGSSAGGASRPVHRRHPLRPAALTLLVTLLSACPSAPLSNDDDDDAGTPERVDQPLLCAQVTPALFPDPDGGTLVETTHYRLHVRGLSEDEADRLGQLAETAWEGWQAYFPTAFELAPDDPFEVYVEATYDDFSNRLLSDGLNPDDASGAGGYYHPATRSAYIYVQPTVWYTRVLFLHELAHQAHRQSRGDVDVQGWYAEGIAEFISRHDWDGECLRLGVVPHLSLEDPAAQAAATLGDADLTSWFEDGAWSGRPLAMEFLRMGDTEPDLAEGWKALRSILDSQGSADVLTVEEELGLSMSAIEERFVQFVSGDQEPMVPVYLEWLHRTPTSVRGWSEGVITIARNKVTPDQVSLTSEAPESGGAGLLFSWDSGTDFDALVLNPDGALWTFNATEGSNVWNPVGSVTAPSGPVAWTLTHDGDEAVVTVNAEQVRLPLGATPAVGLVVENDDIIFTEISWRP